MMNYICNLTRFKCLLLLRPRVFILWVKLSRKGQKCCITSTHSIKSSFYVKDLISRRQRKENGGEKWKMDRWDMNKKQRGRKGLFTSTPLGSGRKNKIENKRWERWMEERVTWFRHGADRGCLEGITADWQNESLSGNPRQGVMSLKGNRRLDVEATQTDKVFVCLSL